MGSRISTLADVMAPSGNEAPPHPGKVLLRVLENHPGITQSALAKALGTSRLSVNEILNKRRNITADMAVRLEHVLRIDAREWLRIQIEYDLHHAREGLMALLPSLEVLKRTG